MKYKISGDNLQIVSIEIIPGEKIYFLLALIFAIPYYHFTKKREIQEFGSYKIEDAKGKDDGVKEVKK